MSRTVRAEGRAGTARSLPSARTVFWKRFARGAVAALLALGVGAALFVIAVCARVDWNDLVARNGDPEVVYLFAGVDSGIERPKGDSQYAASPDSPGRADVLILVRLGGDGDVHAVSLPRDIVAVGVGRPSRLALTYLDGEQALIDGICGGVGVEVDRFVGIDASAFPKVVDALGGLELRIPEARRDPGANLDVAQSGARSIDGETALALVRSRHAQVLVDGTWVEQSDDAGSEDRATWSAHVMEATRTALAHASPTQLARATWAASGGLTVSGGLHPLELWDLVHADISASVLPTRLVNGELARVPGDAGTQALQELGFDTSCRPMALAEPRRSAEGS